MARFETDVLCHPDNLDALMAMSGQWVDRICQRRPTSKLILDMDSSVTGANRNDITQLLPLVEAIPPVAGKPGHPRRRPDRVQGDRACDSQPHRDQLRHRHIVPVLARRRTEHGSGLGVHRWVIERTIAWLFQHRRLRFRYERRPDIHEAFVLLALCLICWNFLSNSLC